jgi:hypothetical protein
VDEGRGQVDALLHALGEFGHRAVEVGVATG